KFTNASLGKWTVSESKRLSIFPRPENIPDRANFGISVPRQPLLEIQRKRNPMDVRKFWNPVMPGVSNRRAQQKLGRRAEKHVPLACPFHVPSMSMQLRPEHWDR